ncbi:MAG: hypothetical protein ACLTZB_06790 [Streptococcus salivarius]
MLAALELVEQPVLAWEWLIQQLLFERDFSLLFFFSCLFLLFRTALLCDFFFTKRVSL